MTIRKIIFIFIAILLSALFLLQFWLIQNFTKDVSSKIGEAAFEVSRSTIETILFKQPDIEFSNFAISGSISGAQQFELLQALSNTPSDVNISLKDGQTDRFLTINSSGVKHKVDIPRTGIEKSLESMSDKTFFSAVFFIVMGLITASFFSRKFSRTLKELAIASERVGRGEFGFQVETHSQYQSIEIKNTINAFNEMSLKIDSLQKENDALNKQAQLKELSEITRGLAHTIRNPLNTLNLAVDQLAHTDDAKNKQELVKISKFQVQRIDRWVRSLIDVMSSDSLVETLDLGQLVETTISDIQLGTSAQIVIHFKQANEYENNTERKIEVYAIKPELKSIIQGLIVNAVEATKESRTQTQVKNISVELYKNQETINLIISDQGKGFSPEIKNKLFSPHNTNKTYGAGMGLYLAHRIITLKYDGDLTINDITQDNDELAIGTRVELTLKNRVQPR